MVYAFLASRVCTTVVYASLPPYHVYNGGICLPAFLTPVSLLDTVLASSRLPVSLLDTVLSLPPSTRFTVGQEERHPFHPFHCRARRKAPALHPFHCWARWEPKTGDTYLPIMVPGRVSHPGIYLSPRCYLRTARSLLPGMVGAMDPVRAPSC